MKTRVRITTRSSWEALELGFAQLVDLAGSVVAYKYKTYRHPERRDAEAIASDWRRVGMDICAASQKADKNGLAN